MNYLIHQLLNTEEINLIKKDLLKLKVKPDFKDNVDLSENLKNLNKQLEKIKIKKEANLGKNLTLTGMMGVGKSTIAKILAKNVYLKHGSRGRS